MRNPLNKIILLCLFLFAAVLLAGRCVYSKESETWKELDEVLSEVEKADKKFKTIKADIVFTRSIPLLDSTEKYNGEMRYKKPKRLFLKFFPPRNEINIMDGEHLWVYHPEQKQAEKYKLKNNYAHQNLHFFDWGYGQSVAAAKKNFKITLSDTKETEGKRFYILDLQPKGNDSQYSNVRLWIEEDFWLPGKVELYESGGEVVNIIEMKNIVLNKRIPDKLFEFDVPWGVEVIEPF